MEHPAHHRRGKDCGQQDHHEQGGVKFAAAVDDAACQANRDDNQTDFAARYHAHANPQRFPVVKPAHARAQSRAKDFAKNGHQQQDQHEGNGACREGAKVSFQADIDKKYRDEEDVSQATRALLDLVFHAAVGQLAQADAGDKGAGDRRHAAQIFGRPAKEQGGNQGKNRQAIRLRQFRTSLYPSHQARQDKPGDQKGDGDITGHPQDNDGQLAEVTAGAVRAAAGQHQGK